MKEKNKKLLYLGLINMAFIIYGAIIICVYVLSERYGLSELVKCPSIRFLGIYCPFCGGTRALSSLLKFDLLASLYYNPALLPSIIAFAFYDIRAFIYLKKGKTEFKYLHKTVWIPLLSLLIISWIAKNILLLGFGINILA
ncbi:MAG: DUF2752 domain-containing protein [Ruminococcaceae bacterium]|nr:DUF2752 domain-containing protein [Oscillospiraceae bacterium]